MKGKVNYNAEGTWLEPWIGWSFPVIRLFKKTAIIAIDRGDQFKKYRIDRKLLTV